MWIIQLDKTMNKYTETLKQFNDLDEEWEQKWLIESLIPEGEPILLYAPSGSYKTFIALHIALLIANGKNSLGESNKRKTLYLVLEGKHGFKKRIEALRSYDLSSDNFDMTTEAFDILNATDVKHLMECIREGEFGFVVIDTLSKCIGSGDESQTSVAREIMTAMEFITQSTGASLLMVHHEGKKAYSGARGSSLLTADVSTVLKIRPKDMKGSLIIEKDKAGNEGKKYNFVMQPYKETLYANFDATEIQSSLALLIMKSISNEPIAVSEISKNLFQLQSNVTSQESFRRKVYREIDTLLGQGDLEVVTGIKPKSVRRRNASH